MKMKKSCGVLLTLVVVVTLGFAHDVKGKATGHKHTVELKDATGESVGTATLKQGKEGVVIHLNVKGLPAGEHGLHFHQIAKCEADPAQPADAFKSAGGHFNPESKKHGLENPQGPHAGDMSNFTVGSDGRVRTRVTNPRVTLEEGRPNSLFADGGTALVIHAKADDLKTDPAGNAGARIACGTITK